jgi:hypothetical protein
VNRTYCAFELGIDIRSAFACFFCTVAELLKIVDPLAHAILIVRSHHSFCRRGLFIKSINALDEVLGEGGVGVTGI